MNAFGTIASAVCCAALLCFPCRLHAGAATMPAGMQSGGETARAGSLPDGTPIHLSLAETISSADAKPGQQVTLEVAADVQVQGVTVIPKGTTAQATVVDAERKKGLGRGGKLALSVDSIRLLDREKVTLRVTATSDNTASGRPGAGFLLFPDAPSSSFSHAREITLTKGMECTVFTDGTVRVDLQAFAALGVAARGYTPDAHP